MLRTHILLQISRIAVVLACVLMGACASQSARNDVAIQDVDPWEGFNRKMFDFNLKLDRWVLRPVAKGYDTVTPDPVQEGVGNFFSNIGEVPNVVNNVLQWKWKRAGLDTSRLLINSTFGVLGIFDVADAWGVKEGTGEDAGQTLGRWGIKQGPYLVLPVFGSTTLRDGLMRPVNIALDPVTYVSPTFDRAALSVGRLIDLRAGLLSIDNLASGDLYIFLRDAHLQRRKFLEADGKLEDEFEDDFGEGGFGDDSFDEDF